MVELGKLCIRRSIKVQVVKTLKRVKRRACFPFSSYLVFILKTEVSTFTNVYRMPNDQRIIIYENSLKTFMQKAENIDYILEIIACQGALLCQAIFF